MDKKIEEARREFNEILDYLIFMAASAEIHEAEEGLYKRLLRLGKILLEIFILAVGTGEMGETVVDGDGQRYRHVGKSTRQYVSIFGEIIVSRTHYAREGKSGLFPLDGRLNLPRRKYSYPLQGRMGKEAVKSSYESVSSRLKNDFDLEIAHRPIQRVVGDCTEVAEVDHFCFFGYP